jgi:hypothetical protein
MPSLNLLPPWVIRKQQNRKIIIRLSVIQAVIILFFASTALTILFITERTENQTHALTILLLDERYIEPDRIAEQVRAAGDQIHTQAAMLMAVTPSYFEYAWLNAVSLFIPPKTELIGIEIKSPGMTISCLTNEWQGIESYRISLENTGIYEWVRFGEIAGQAEGRIRFEINCGLAP